MSLLNDFLKLCKSGAKTDRYIEIVSSVYKVDTYCEVHHIWPRCMWDINYGNINCSENMIILPYSLHVECHQLLPDIVIDLEHSIKLLYAVKLMTNDDAVSSDEFRKTFIAKSNDTNIFGKGTILDNKELLIKEYENYPITDISKKYNLKESWITKALKIYEIPILSIRERRLRDRNKILESIIITDEIIEKLSTNTEVDVAKEYGIDISRFRQKLRIENIIVDKKITNSAIIAKRDPEILRLYENLDLIHNLSIMGFTGVQIGVLLNFPATLINKKLRKLGVCREFNKFSDLLKLFELNKNEIIEFYNLGFGITDFSKKFDIPPTTSRKLLIKMGIIFKHKNYKPVVTITLKEEFKKWEPKVHY